MNRKIGGPFPDLALPDHSGSAVKLSQIAARFPLVLVFYRGHW